MNWKQVSLLPLRSTLFLEAKAWILVVSIFYTFSLDLKVDSVALWNKVAVLLKLV